ncbi:MAG: dephospho-CoA kinase [Anaerolineae bacterium]|nr:dephospho-CoA kinase [Anaerolineae bacterium]
MGKSLVRKMLEQLGAYTIDADGLAHQVMAPGAPAYRPVIETFGRWIVSPDGKIDRSKLGAVAFSHPEALARLEALTHPIVGQGIDTLVSRAQQPIVVIEAIKLVDGQIGGWVDTIWVVDTAPSVQVERLVKRGLPEADAHKRISMQNPQRDKLARANVTISNSGTPQDTWVQVEREWKKILEARGLKLRQTDEVRTVKISQPSAPPAAQPPRPQPVTPSTTLSAAPTAPPSQPVIKPLTTTPTPAQPPAEPVHHPSTPVVTTVTPPTSETVSVSVKIRRGMPATADQIAQLINQQTGKTLTRLDVMTSFGEKSYLLADMDNKIVGLAGFQVENLITRMDEFIILPGTPQAALAEALIGAVEQASKELQSEVGLMFVSNNAPPSISDVFNRMEYQKMELDTIKVPAWREAAEEAQPPNSMLFAKKLRAERVLKPL